MPPLTARQEEVLALMLEEVWDLSEAIDELEARRAKLRDAILGLCRAGPVLRYRHPRGALRVDRYASYHVPAPSALLPLLAQRAWTDDVLQVKGRVLHRLAAPEPAVAEALRASYREVRHEVLVLTPASDNAKASCARRRTTPGRPG